MVDLERFNRFPQWGPLVPCYHRLSPGQRAFVARFVDFEAAQHTVTHGGASFEPIYRQSNICDALGGMSPDRMRRLEARKDLPIYRDPSGHAGNGRILVMSPLCQLVRWAEVHLPSSVLGGGVGRGVGHQM